VKLCYALLIESYPPSTDGATAIGGRGVLIAGGVGVQIAIVREYLSSPPPPNDSSHYLFKLLSFLYIPLSLLLPNPFTMAPKVAIVYVRQFVHARTCHPS
jgi:hypothetical protein